MFFIYYIPVANLNIPPLFYSLSFWFYLLDYLGCSLTWVNSAFSIAWNWSYIQELLQFRKGIQFIMLFRLQKASSHSVHVHFQGLFFVAIYFFKFVFNWLITSNSSNGVLWIIPNKRTNPLWFWMGFCLANLWSALILKSHMILKSL